MEFMSFIVRTILGGLFWLFMLPYKGAIRFWDWFAPKACYVTKHGVQFRIFEGAVFPQALAEEMEDWVIFRIMQLDRHKEDDIKRAMRTALVRVVPEVIEIGGEKFYGLYDPNFRVIAVWDRGGKPEASAYIHELGHLIYDVLSPGHDGDRHHQDETYWHILRGFNR